MFGLVDRFYAAVKTRKGYVEPEVDWSPDVRRFDGEPCSWFCFIPAGVASTPFLSRGILPSEGNVFVYTFSALNLIKSNPEETVNRLQEIYDDAFARIELELTRNRSLNMLGVSLGNVLSIRAAGEIGSGVDKLVSIVGGGKLGLSAWDSVLTGKIARQSRYSSSEEYESELAVFSPVNYIGRIDANEIRVELASKDLFIPFKHGKELAKALGEQACRTGANFHYKVFRGADHCSALLFSALSGSDF